jgi:hypothetical protein
MTVDKMSIDEMTVDKMSLDKMTVDGMTCCHTHKVRNLNRWWKFVLMTVGRFLSSDNLFWEPTLLSSTRVGYHQRLDKACNLWENY